MNQKDTFYGYLKSAVVLCTYGDRRMRANAYERIRSVYGIGTFTPVLARECFSNGTDTSIRSQFRIDKALEEATA
jgi:hypothetical protein